MGAGDNTLKGQVLGPLVGTGGGALAGAIWGQMAIPIPVVGALIGGIGGALVGGTVGTLGGGVIGGVIGGARDIMSGNGDFGSFAAVGSAGMFAVGAALALTGVGTVPGVLMMAAGGLGTIVSTAGNLAGGLFNKVGDVISGIFGGGKKEDTGPVVISSDRAIATPQPSMDAQMQGQAPVQGQRMSPEMVAELQRQGIDPQQLGSRVSLSEGGYDRVAPISDEMAQSQGQGRG